jgi:hypothetical protein
MSELLPLPRMARRIGVTQSWLKKQAEAGTVPCLDADSRLLFEPVAVTAALVTLASNGTATAENGSEVTS